ncbi:MAG: hypothetical protein ACRDXX_05830 [Stackebrandtia sp.]
MVTYAQLINMDTSRLSAAASTAGSLSSSLSDRGALVQSRSDIPEGMWNGADASAAGGALEILTPPLFDASDAFKRGRAALEDLVDGVDAAKERLQDAHNLVAGTGITISSDGDVFPPLADDPAEAERLGRLAEQAREIIADALRMADEADNTAVDAIGAVAGDVGDFFKDRFGPGVNVDARGGTSLGLGNHKNDLLGWSGTGVKVGPVGVNTGGVALTDNPYPGVSLDRWPPKVSVPFVNASIPNVSVDVQKTQDFLEKNNPIRKIAEGFHLR